MKRAHCRPPRASRGFAALIEILLVALLILGGAAMYMGMLKGTGAGQKASPQLTNGAPAMPGVSEPQSLAGKAIQKAHGTECQSNLAQLRQFILMSQGTDGKYPPSLGSIQGTEQIRVCPVCHQPYTYDPETGQVKCPYPGHANF